MVILHRRDHTPLQSLMRLPLFTAVRAPSQSPRSPCPPVSPRKRPSGEVVSPKASQIHRRAIVVDTHDDTTQRLLYDKTFDIGRRHDNGSIDVPRMREGGLDELSFPSGNGDVTGPPAVRRAMALIDKRA